MDQDEIREIILDLNRRQQELQVQIQAVAEEKARIQGLCAHPNIKTCVNVSDFEYHFCPDCHYNDYPNLSR